MPNTPTGGHSITPDSKFSAKISVIWAAIIALIAFVGSTTWYVRGYAKDAETLTERIQAMEQAMITKTALEITIYKERSATKRMLEKGTLVCKGKNSDDCSLIFPEIQ